MNNPTVSSLEDFGEALADFGTPNLFLVGGLQMMDNFPFKEGVRYGTSNMGRIFYGCCAVLYSTVHKQS